MDVCNGVAWRFSGNLVNCDITKTLKNLISIYHVVVPIES